MFNIKKFDFNSLSLGIKELLLNNAASLPISLRTMIQMNNVEILRQISSGKSVNATKVRIDKYTVLTRLFHEHPLLQLIDNSEFSEYAVYEARITRKLFSLGFPIEANDVLVSLIRSECYDLETLCNFEQLCTTFISKLDGIRYAKSRNEIIKFITENITKFKIKQMFEIMNELQKYINIDVNEIDNSIDNRIQIIYDSIMNTINHKYDRRITATLLKIYIAICNCNCDIDKYIAYIGVKYSDEEASEVKLLMGSIDGDYQSLIDMIPKEYLKVDSFNPIFEKVDYDEDKPYLNEITGNHLLFGNINSKNVTRDDIISLAGKVTKRIVSHIVNKNVMFTLSPDQLAEVSGVGFNIINVVIRMSDFTNIGRSIIIYDEHPYVLYVVDFKSKVFAISYYEETKEWHIISIQDPENNYTYKVDGL